MLNVKRPVQRQRHPNEFQFKQRKYIIVRLTLQTKTLYCLNLHIYFDDGPISVLVFFRILIVDDEKFLCKYKMIECCVRLIQLEMAEC